MRPLWQKAPTKDRSTFSGNNIHTEEANEEHYKSRKDAIAKDLAHYEEQLASYKKDRQNAQEKANDTGNRLEAAKEQLLKQITRSRI